MPYPSSWAKGFSAPQIFEHFNSQRRQKNGSVHFTELEFFSEPPISWELIEHNLIPAITLNAADKHRLVRQTLNEPTSSGKLSCDDFIRILDEKLRKFIKPPEQKYHILTSLSYVNLPPFKSISIDAVKIDFVKSVTPKYDCTDTYDNSLLRDQLKRILRPQTSEYPSIIIKSDGLTVHDATSKGFKAAEKVRAIFNWYLNSSNFSRMSAIPSIDPINRFRWGQIHTIHNSHGARAYDGFYFEKDFYQCKNYGCFQDNLHFVGFFNKVRTKARNSPLRDVFWEGITRYSAALDQTNWSDSFRNLWSTLELLTGTGRKNYDFTVHRAASLYENYAYHKEILNYLRFLRNDIVHNNSDLSGSEAKMFLIKRHIEHIIKVILFNPFEFESMQEFCDFLDQPKDKVALLRRIRLAESAVKFRSL